MTTASLETLASINSLPLYKKQQLVAVLSLLIESTHIDGIMLGGSLSYTMEADYADVDLFCLAASDNFDKSRILNLLHPLGEIDCVVNQGFYPWTQSLQTIYYKADFNFSIDLCIIQLGQAETFFWEPQGVLLFDRSGRIEGIRNRQAASKTFTCQPFQKTNPFTLSIVTIKKIRKSLLRGRLWNAIELTNIFRRYVFQILRSNVYRDATYLGRPDRNIEEVFSTDLIETFSKTIPMYAFDDIRQKTIALIAILEANFEVMSEDDHAMREWILNQLKHEEGEFLHLKEPHKNQ